jgi:hypothetical protein
MKRLQSVASGGSSFELFGEIPASSKAVRPKLAPVKSHKSMPVFSGGLFALNDTVGPERFGTVFHSGASSYLDSLIPTGPGKDVGAVTDLMRPSTMPLLNDNLTRQLTFLYSRRHSIPTHKFSAFRYSKLSPFP